MQVRIKLIIDNKTLCHSIVHRHVPETDFGTGSMKYLPELCCSSKTFFMNSP